MHLAVLVTAVMQWIIGAIWYSLLFAKPWSAMVAVPQEGKNKTMLTGMLASFIGSLITSFALAHMIIWSGAATFAWGMLVGFICWLGFIAAPLFAQGIYESRPFKLFAINTGYWLVSLLLTGGILAIWH
jgi:hypothetical protein